MAFYLINKSGTAITYGVNNLDIKDKINNGLNIVPALCYIKAYTDKSLINAENKGRSGIYRLNNLLTCRNYIGSWINQTGSFSNYYSVAYLKKIVEKGSSIL